MALPAACSTLEQELDLFALHFRDFAATKAAITSSAGFSFAEECLLEGLLSRVWQSWCKFCRACIVESCIGSTTAAGIPIVGLPSATNEAEVSGAAIRAKKNQQPYWAAAPNTVLRFEPMWGDVDVLNKIIQRIAPSNSAQLLAAFSAGSASAKAIQLIRNGASHNHVQNLAEINALASTYLAFPIVHPIHAMFWTEPVSRDFLITAAIQDLRFTGSVAIA